MAVELIIALALVVANGFFVATEFAVTRLRLTEAIEMERAGRPGARSARHAVEHIDAYLAACQLGITLASIGLGVVGKPVFEELLEPLLGEGASVAGFGVAAACAFVIITVLHVVVGELAPKSMAISRTRSTSLLVAPWMRAFYLASKPVVDLFNAMGNVLLKPFGIPPASEAGHAPHSEGELRALLLQSQDEGLIDRTDRELTENVFAFGDCRAREIMSPRPQIDFVSTDDDVQGVARRAMTSGHTRLPLCEPDGGLEAPVGVIHVKDLLEAILDQRDVSLADVARPLARVSESTLLSELMRDLRRRHQHIALVADEHGTTTGLVTLEDILEELVGEIEDEFDTRASEEFTHDGSAILIDGGASFRMLEQELRVKVSEPHEATVGGHLVEVLGRVPEVGEILELDGYNVEVRGVDEARITQLRFEARQP
ncbi:MAG: hemolysin family protein [Actinomycetota bacterium]|nr:hemolysin family protein [Actinomycetota bacterium]